ncbi:hypothetical protein [Candidatus Lokiarchaeum ossiferum]|uniref:hypothetical protein n=1 Tax=Candidatus Lokiarchaeum ossiferum TaxID=2951803 RepID=UPI00352F9509
MHRPLITEIIQNMAFKKCEFSKDDKLYIFGRNPELSLAEIISRFHVIGSTYKIKAMNKIGVVIEAPKHISISNCGAVLKRSKPLTTIHQPLNVQNIKKDLTDHIINEFFEEKGNWTISYYAKKMGPEEEYLYQTVQKIIKNSLKKAGVRKAFFFKGEKNNIVEPRRLWRKRVIQDGLEIIIWQNKGEFTLWQTEEVINIDEIAKRDSDRPHKRPLLLLGLALARSMINLVSIESNHHDRPIYDAFCGMGSIVSEAYHLGLQSLGSDIDGSCTTRSQENLRWISHLKPNRKKRGIFQEKNIFTMDVMTPDMDRLKNFNGSIVSEPNLLTPLKKYPTYAKANALLDTFEKNYRGYLAGIRKILPKNGICVLIFPQFHISTNERVGLNIIQLLGDFGFKMCEFSIDSYKYPAHFVHSWKDPIIERQIVVFKKV